MVRLAESPKSRLKELRNEKSPNQSRLGEPVRAFLAVLIGETKNHLARCDASEVFAIQENTLSRM